jgi:hypothetical protein
MRRRRARFRIHIVASVSQFACQTTGMDDNRASDWAVGRVSQLL